MSSRRNSECDEEDQSPLFMAARRPRDGDSSDMQTQASTSGGKAKKQVGFRRTSNDEPLRPQIDPEVAEELRRVLSNHSPVLQQRKEPARPRPALRKGESSFTPQDSTAVASGAQTPEEVQAYAAYERGKQLEHRQHARVKSVDIETESDSEHEPVLRLNRAPTLHHAEAERLVHAHISARKRRRLHAPFVRTTEPYQDREDDQAVSTSSRGGILGMLMSLDNRSANNSRRNSFDDSSGASTPNRLSWAHEKNASTGSLAKLIGASTLGATTAGDVSLPLAHRTKAAGIEGFLNKRSTSASALSTLGKLASATTSSKHRKKHRITIHIAEIIARQRYLVQLCRALMQYGAPTHRLEENMKATARVLEIDAQFLYLPGCMMISFDDPQTHTASVRLVRVDQGIDLGKLRDVHELYKSVVHDRIGVEEATIQLTEIEQRKPKYTLWLRILLYGLASASCGAFGFGAGLRDLPILLVLGSIVGWLQLYYAPRSELYSHVFVITATVLTSFLARAFGSIRGGTVFCFSGLAQSSIALILPGYTVLCASLELQSHSIVAGSVRMVFAIIYSLFLGFGIMIGTAIYGRIDSSATSETTCHHSIAYPYNFIAVPIFTLCMIVINQGKWKQMPVMVIIACAGYLTNHYTAAKFETNTQIATTLGAFTIGVLANLHSRLGRRIENWWLGCWKNTLRPTLRRCLPTSAATSPTHDAEKAENFRTTTSGASTILPTTTGTATGRSTISPATSRAKSQRVGYGLAAAAMLPAIFVLVPSGLAVQGSLVAGLASANSLNSNTTTAGGMSAAEAVTSGNNNIAFNVTYSVIQVAIGITVGLFLAAMVVYPGGKRRSGLFSF